MSRIWGIQRACLCSWSTPWVEANTATVLHPETLEPLVTVTFQEAEAIQRQLERSQAPVITETAAFLYSYDAEQWELEALPMQINNGVVSDMVLGPDFVVVATDYEGDLGRIHVGSVRP